MSSGKFVFISIAVLVLLSGAGCIDSEAQSAPVNTPAPVSTETATATATPEPTKVPVENWWDSDSKLVYGNYDSSFFGNVEGIKNIEHTQNGYYTIMNDAGDNILRHQEWNPSNLYLAQRLQPEQYRALVDKYGGMVSVTMEQIDDDRDGTFDRVAVKYIGDEGSFYHESDNPDKSLTRLIWDFMKTENLI